MKLFSLLFLLPLPVIGQSYSSKDCRSQEGQSRTPCYFEGTSLGPERFIGTGKLIGPTLSAPFFSPYTEGEPVSKPTQGGGRQYEISAYYSIQSQFLSYQNHNSDGYKVAFAKQWTDLLGIEVRGSVQQYDLIKAGRYPGSNGTEAIAFGPRVQHSFDQSAPDGGLGRVTPYGEF